MTSSPDCLPIWWLIFDLQAKELRPGSVDAEEEVSHGLQSYFDKCLLPLLLYRGERAQAGQVCTVGS